jgi:hypothetical protein
VVLLLAEMVGLEHLEALLLPDALVLNRRQNNAIDPAISCASAVAHW